MSAMRTSMPLSIFGEPAKLFLQRVEVEHRLGGVFAAAVAGVDNRAR